MSLRRERQALQRQLVETEQLYNQVADHPFMGPQMAYRLTEIQADLNDLPENTAEARTALFFSGKPVEGTRAIDAKFAGKALDPYLEMVKTQYSTLAHGQVSQRGPRRDENDASLVITGTPRGSFGFELEAPLSDDLFAEERLADALMQVTRMIEAAGTSDDDYLRRLDDLADRSFSRLKDFFKILKDSEAGLRVETGDIQVDMPPSRIVSAYERINRSTETIQDRMIEGVFRGATLESWRFDLKLEEGEVISGRISAELTEDEVADMIRRTNEHCSANVRQITVTMTSGTLRRRYVLLNLL